jgi:hypothetical protein
LLFAGRHRYLEESSASTSHPREAIGTQSGCARQRQRASAPAAEPDLLDRQAIIGDYMLKSGKIDPRATAMV